MSFSVAVVYVHVIVIFVNVFFPVQVFAPDNDIKPVIAVDGIEAEGIVIVPADTVKPLLNVCNPENVFVVFVA